MSIIKRIWSHINNQNRFKLGLLLFLMLIVPCFEVATISSLLPLLGSITSNDDSLSHPVELSVKALLGEYYSIKFLLLIFSIMVLATGAMRLAMLWFNVRLSFAIGADITNTIYNNVLNQPYRVHILRNSSDVINTITNKSHLVIHNAIMPSLMLISGFFMFVSMLGTLLYIDSVAIGLTVGGLCLIYSIAVLLTRSRLSRDSGLIAQHGTDAIKAVQEGLGSIRDILMDGTHQTYSLIYQKIDKRLRRAQGNTIIVGHGIRFAVETFGLLFLVGIIYVLSTKPNGLVGAVPVLGVLVMGIQRLLPVMQQAYNSWMTLLNGQASVLDALSLLELKTENAFQDQMDVPFTFKSTITFNNIGFRYQNDSPWVFRCVNFEIKKGDRVGLAGPTGCGKSTLMDIFMGLLDASEGQINIDGHPLTLINRGYWRNHIAHVPQSIYLSDSTIEANVAFGVPRDKVDHEGVKKCCQQANISEVIEALPDQYLTRVGERGVRLSGGQRQRIGIARALYKNASIIVFDEATSALDNRTEIAVIEEIGRLNENLTIIIIAHRLTTLKVCSKVIELQDGRISRIVSPDALLM